MTRIDAILIVGGVLRKRLVCCRSGFITLLSAYPVRRPYVESWYNFLYPSITLNSIVGSVLYNFLYPDYLVYFELSFGDLRLLSSTSPRDLFSSQRLHTPVNA